MKRIIYQLTNTDLGSTIRAGKYSFDHSISNKTIYISFGGEARLEYAFLITKTGAGYKSGGITFYYNAMICTQMCT